MMQQKILLTILIFIVLIVGGIIFWLPQFQKYRILRLQLQEEKARLETKKEYFSQLQRLSDKLKEHQSEIQKIDSALPLYPEIADVLNFLQKKAQENGLIIEGIAVGKTVLVRDFPGLKKSSLQIKFLGDYPSYKNLVSVLEKSARLIDIDLISFQRSEKGPSSFETQISFYSYIKK